MSRTLNRRTFVKGTALAAGFWVTGLPAAAAPRSPNEKLNIGIIGVNNRGRANTDGVRTENVVALCDVDENYLGAAARRFPKARTHRDWRKLLEQKDVDAVVVSTTDHTHAPASVMAMRQ